MLLELVRSESEPGQPHSYLSHASTRPSLRCCARGRSGEKCAATEDAAFLAEMVVGILNAAVTNWLADPDYPIEQRLRQASQFAWEAIGLESG